MKKIILSAAFVVAAAFGIIKVNDVNYNDNMNALQIENVEALADGESFKSPCKDKRYYYCMHWDGSYSLDSKNRR